MKPTRGLFRWNSQTKKLERIDKPKKLEVHYVQTDTMDPMESFATFDKPIFDSKSAYRRHLREHDMYETGGAHLNEKQESPEAIAKREEAETAETVRQSYFDVKYGRVPFTEREKEQHEREKRALGREWKIKAPY